MIRMANEARKAYELAIKKDANNFWAYLGFGQWYFFAPKIGGGSMQQAEKYYKQAEKRADLPYQKYLVAIWKSQIYFLNKREQLYKAELDKAKSIYPNGGFYEYVTAFNKKGKSL